MHLYCCNYSCTLLFMYAYSYIMEDYYEEAQKSTIYLIFKLMMSHMTAMIQFMVMWKVTTTIAVIAVQN